MDISSLYCYFYFKDFGAFVNWFTSHIPSVLLAVFVCNCLFSVLSYLVHLGDK